MPVMILNLLPGGSVLQPGLPDCAPRSGGNAFRLAFRLLIAGPAFSPAGLTWQLEKVHLKPPGKSCSVVAVRGAARFRRRLPALGREIGKAARLARAAYG